MLLLLMLAFDIVKRYPLAAAASEYDLCSYIKV